LRFLIFDLRFLGDLTRAGYLNTQKEQGVYWSMKIKYIHAFWLVGVLAASPLFPAHAEVSPNAARMFGNAIADVVEKTMPSVVVVRTETVKNRYARDWLFGYVYKIPERLAGQGSGVIINDDGYILTNNHVIDDASSVEVVLNDGTKLPAEIIGRDPHTDLSVLRILETDELQVAAVEIGDSDELRVGEFVIALGSPFSLASSVTLGIVSQKGRSIGMLPFEDFIQTDAAVNQGNSGGPLLDVDGRLVGHSNHAALPRQHRHQLRHSGQSGHACSGVHHPRRTLGAALDWYLHARGRGRGAGDGSHR
jgi:S1-C subfamily serine protease